MIGKSHSIFADFPKVHNIVIKWPNGDVFSLDIINDDYRILFDNVHCRGFVVLLGTGALFCSIYTAMTCRFFSFRTLDGEPWEGLAPPFDQSAHSSVGFFKYSLTEPDKNEGLTFLNKECSTYDDWGDVGQNIYFYISQWCSLAAAVAGFLAWVSNVSEVMCCKFFGSRPLTLVLFVVAAVLQCGTFLIFGDDQFW